MGLRRIRERRKRLFVKRIFHVAQTVCVVPTLVVQTARWALWQPIVVPELHQFNMVKPHVGAMPIVRKLV